MTDSGVHTAVDMTVEDRKRYDPARAIHQRQVATRPELSRRRRRALRTARQAASLLRETYSAQRVVLFGSLAKRAGFTLWSDIDLAVLGISHHLFYAAVAAVTGLSPEFKIDLVDLAACKPSLRTTIEHEGIDL
jgi:uncharacterized protein